MKELTEENERLRVSLEERSKIITQKEAQLKELNETINVNIKSLHLNFFKKIKPQGKKWYSCSSSKRR